MYLEIDNEWYCVNCEADHNCVNCDLMNVIFDEIKRNKNKVFSVINKRELQNNQNNPICFDCWKTMIKSKFKKWPQYWCPCNKK